MLRGKCDGTILERLMETRQCERSVQGGSRLRKSEEVKKVVQELSVSNGHGLRLIEDMIGICITPIA